MFLGVIGENAFPLGLRGVGRTPAMYSFVEAGRAVSESYEIYYSEDLCESYILCVRAPSYPGWKAASQGFSVSFSYEWGKL